MATTIEQLLVSNLPSVYKKIREWILRKKILRMMACMSLYVLFFVDISRFK